MAIGELSLKPLYEAQQKYYQAEQSGQVARENEIKLAQLEKSVQDTELADKLLKESYGAQPDQAAPPPLTQSFMPGEPVAPTEMPGTVTPKEGLMGLGGMQQGITGVEAPQQPKQELPIASKAQQSMGKVSQSQKMQQALENAIDKAAREGKTSVVDMLTKRLSDQRTNETSYQKEHLANTEKVYETLGRIGTGYINAVKTDPNSEGIAWQRAAMEMLQNGFPIDQLQQARTPQQRMALAMQAQGMGEKAGDVIRQQVAELNAKTRTKIATENLAWKEKVQNWKERDAADKKEFRELQRQDKLEKTQFDHLKDQIQLNQKDISETDTQIKSLETRKGKITSLQELINPNTGTAYTPEERQETVADIDNQLADLNQHRQSLADAVAEREGLLKQVGIKPEKASAAAEPTAPDKPAAPEATPSVPYTSLNTQEKAWVDANLKGNPGFTQDQIIEEGIKSGVIVKREAPEPEAVKYINTEAQLTKAIKAGLLKPEEIKAAKAKLKRLEATRKSEQTSKAEEKRLSKLKGLGESDYEIPAVM